MANKMMTDLGTHVGGEFKSHRLRIEALEGFSEAVTEMSLVANQLSYKDENGSTVTYDLSTYLDDTNLARVISGTYNSVAKELVFTRDDASTFSIDASMFFDDTNLVTSVNGQTGAVTIPAYSHPVHPGDDFSVDTGALTGATVISDIDINVTTDTNGHVTDANGSVATRNLTLGDLGYTGAPDANKYVHPIHAGDDINIDTGALSGATVISDLDFNVTTDTNGHVTDANATIATRNITAGDVGALGATAKAVDSDKLDGINSTSFARTDISTERFDAGANTTVEIKCDDAGKAMLNVSGDGQGTGQIYVGQSNDYGGGIEYNGDNSPSTTGAGADMVTLYRKSAGVESWTARNSQSNNNWEFRGDIKAPTFTGTASNADKLENKSLATIKTEVLNEIKDGAGTAYDTLKEIQTEIEANDGDISAVMTSLGNKVSIDSPQAMRATDALTVSNDTITIHKGDGTSESVSISDSNTWRGIQNNLTSTSTTDSLSAYQGKLLQDNKLDKTAKAADSDKLDGIDSSGFVRFFNQATTPTTAPDGSLWRDSDTGTVFIGINDSGTLSWFQV